MSARGKLSGLALWLALQAFNVCCIDDLTVGRTPAVVARPEPDASTPEPDASDGASGGAVDPGPCAPEDCEPVQVGVVRDANRCDSDAEPVCVRHADGYCFLQCPGITVQSVCGEEAVVKAECGENRFCRQALGSCSGQGGVCSERPVGCSEAQTDPVCGCDGVTYESDCAAYAKGINLRARGACL